MTPIVSSSSKMEDPKIPWTIADLSSIPSAKMGVVYHVMGTPFDLFNPTGAVIGGLLSFTSFGKRVGAIPMIANGGLLAGGAGMSLGLMALYGVSQKGEQASPPWNDEGIQQRVDGLRHNFHVRILDLSVWSGIGLAGGITAFIGGPAKLGLANGTLGVLQALSLGSTVGSLAGMGCIAVQEYKVRKFLEEDDV